jgi:hypothetical protein
VHAHVQRLVSLFKMLTVLEECNTEEHSSVVRYFCGQKDSLPLIFIMKCFLFTAGSVFRVKQFTTESRNSLKDILKFQMMPDQVALLKL